MQKLFTGDDMVLGTGETSLGLQGMGILLDDSFQPLDTVQSHGEIDSDVFWKVNTVPNVQELAKQPMTTLPPRYIRSDQESPVILNPTSSSTVPVIDMQKLFGGDDREHELNKLHMACKEWGFFQLVNHEISTRLVEQVKHGIQDFFNLPIEEKKKFWQLENEVEGFGQAFVVSKEQNLDWGDLFFMATFPVKDRKPHLFPMLPLPFRDDLEAYAMNLKTLAMKILAMMEKALKVDPENITSLFEDGTQSVRMNYYPPCSQPDQVIGLTPHSDSVGLTILLQVNEMEGLQIKKEGMWIPIKPLPNAFIVNVGDIMEIITNGVYRSIEHRATVNNVKERLSMATFLNPSFEAEVGHLPALITPHTPALYRKVTMKDYIQGLFLERLMEKHTSMS